MILEVVNSFIDRPGNIGIRTARILRELSSRAALDSCCIARGGTFRARGIRVIGMGPLGHVPRLLNALRIYLFPKFNHRIADIALFERFAATASRWFCRRKPSVAHVWEYAPALITRLKAEGIPVMLDVPIAPTAYAERLWLDGRCSHLMREPAQIELEKKAFALADLLLAPSSFVAEELERLGVPKKRIRVVPFGVDMPAPSEADPFSVHSAEGDGAASAIDWVMLGNVNLRKGVRELLAAFSDPVFARDRLHLCGRVSPDVRALLAEAGANVLTPGFVNPAEYLKRCDVFVMPSWMEGSSKAVFEAMAMGLPAIVSRSTGSVVRDGVDGFLVEAGDVDGLKGLMIRFREDPALIAEMGRSASARARSFSWERYAGTVADIYTEFLQR